MASVTIIRYVMRQIGLFVRTARHCCLYTFQCVHLIREGISAREIKIERRGNMTVIERFVCLLQCDVLVVCGIVLVQRIVDEVCRIVLVPVQCAMHCASYL